MNCLKLTASLFFFCAKLFGGRGRHWQRRAPIRRRTQHFLPVVPFPRRLSKKRSHGSRQRCYVTRQDGSGARNPSPMSRNIVGRASRLSSNPAVLSTRRNIDSRRVRPWTLPGIWLGTRHRVPKGRASCCMDRETPRLTDFEALPGINHSGGLPVHRPLHCRRTVQSPRLRRVNHLSN